MMRVVSYNVSGGFDVGAAASVLRRLAPTIVCVLERPGRRRLRRLARDSNLEVAAHAGRRGSGTAILVDGSVRVLATARVPLTAPKDVPTREATQAIVGVRGHRLSVTAVQLGLRPDVRRTNHEELVAYLDSISLPKVIGADLNESVRSPVAADLATRFQDAHGVVTGIAGETYPTTDPSTRQDFVFVDPSLEVLDCRVATHPPADIASHHLPVVADLASDTDPDADTDEERTVT